VNLASRLISSKVGLIKGLGPGMYRAQDPKCFCLGVSETDLSKFSDILSPGKAGGAGETLQSAIASTLGEAVERYCVYFYDKSTMVLAPYRDVPSDAVSPDLLRLYSEEQVNRVRAVAGLEYFTDDSVVNWVWGSSLTTGKPRLVPASMVYMDYRYDSNEASVGRNATTGVAAGATIEEAILTGIQEVIERDAVVISWFHRWPGRRIQIDDPEYLLLMRERFQHDRPNVDLQVFDITLDTAVATMFSYMRRPSELGPVLCVGSASRLDARLTLRKVLLEMSQGLPYFRFLDRQLKDWVPKSDYSDLTSFDHHCMYYVKRPDMADAALAPYRECRHEIKLSDCVAGATGRVLSDIERCVSQLDAIGLEVIVVDVTTPEIVDLGLSVVRVLVPGLVPLHGNERYPYLGVRRLYEIPATLRALTPGWEPSEALNTLPHPFP